LTKKSKKTDTADQTDTEEALAQGPDDLQAQLFALAFHVHAAIRRCDEVWEQARSDHERAAVAVFARSLRDELRAAVSGAPLPPPPPPPPTKLEGERTLALQACGMLALLLAEKSPKFRSGTSPNASAIAEDAARVTEAKLGRNPRGLGHTRVRTTISRAVSTLRGTPSEDRPDERGSD
jgi:hypothetical protein